MHTVRTAFLLALAAIAAFTQDVVPADDPFVMPENLRANVAFWRKIYAEVSLNEGLVHDREHPLVVFRRIKSGQPGDSRRKELLKKHIDEISAMLRNITSVPESEWSGEEKRIKELYDTNAPAGSISGAHERVRFQQGQKERFIEGLQRSGMYLDTIKSYSKSARCTTASRLPTPRGVVVRGRGILESWSGRFMAVHAGNR